MVDDINDRTATKENKTMKNNTKTNAKTNTVKTNKTAMTAKAKPTRVKVEGGLEIIKGLAIPEVSNRRGIKSPIRTTLETMDIGDAFDTTEFKKQHKALQYKLGIKLVTQDLGNGKTRVFRKA